MTGMAMGMKRPAATQFSFLIGIPTMFAASVLRCSPRAAKDLHGIDHQLIIDIALGFFISLVVAFFVVKWLLRFVQSHTFNGFAIYRVILGGALLIALHTGAIPGCEQRYCKAIHDTRPGDGPLAGDQRGHERRCFPGHQRRDQRPSQSNADFDHQCRFAFASAARALPVNPADLTNADATPAQPD